ncbi:MAG: CBS domain-containing protein [Planctomycetota bacterium]
MSELHKSLVRDIMETDVATISAGATIKDALRLMHKTGHSCLVVDLEDASRGVGILTQKDLLAALLDPGEGLNATRVADIMTAPAVSVSPDFAVPTCVQMMRMIGVRRVPVVFNNRLVGLVSFSDVFAHAIRFVL